MVQYGTFSIMVWAGIMVNGSIALHVLETTTITAARYIVEVLLPHVRLFRAAVEHNFLFVDDYAPCHRANAVKDCLESDGIYRIMWAARSPDFNPVGNVWCASGRRLGACPYYPKNRPSWQ